MMTINQLDVSIKLIRIDMLKNFVMQVRTRGKHKAAIELQQIFKSDPKRNDNLQQPSNILYSYASMHYTVVDHL